jgi:hypothetical protein
MEESTIEQLKVLLRWKKSKSYMAKKLKTTVPKLELLLEELKLKKDSFEKKESADKIQVSGYWDHEPTPDEIIKKHKIDTKRWKLSTYWSKGKNKGFLVSAQFSPISYKEDFSQRFENFLKNKAFSVNVNLISPLSSPPNKGVLIVNKQDAHLNKFDIHGKNDIKFRFNQIENKLEKLISQAKLSATVEKIVFVVGSDEFNSEWTGTTTKGTPQQNILTYEEAFEEICQHNLSIIKKLQHHCEVVEVLYIKGNHDEFVGWHMIKWLEAVFNGYDNVIFDTLQLNRKYCRFNKVGLMFNHGDAVSPKELAQIFPMEFREEWSNCVKFNIFTGDKHHEKTLDVKGIKTYQLPALSSSKGRWDDKQGHPAIPEMQIFLIDGETGNTYIFKEFL